MAGRYPRPSGRLGWRRSSPVIGVTDELMDWTGHRQGPHGTHGGDCGGGSGKRQCDENRYYRQGDTKKYTVYLLFFNFYYGNISDFIFMRVIENRNFKRKYLS
ncbi:unnamed protein product [Macrosiphum euphorbiae]|uniref:Uncharacterized protein n=1 Tax=Macrosiphum euphorbiae TaxID=13131 RepID=A0AAV0XB08_9HEMI|nr:unnamed protein product [Macrosiphum euphorbiae]